MKVFWDSYGIVRGPSGIFVHAMELKRALSTKGVEASVLGSTNGQGPFNFFHKLGAKSKALSPLFDFSEFSRHISANTSPAIYHGLSNTNMPLWTGSVPLERVRFVLTVHDLIPLMVQPGWVSRASRMQMAALLPRALARADVVVCVSHWTKNTILERYCGIEKKIHVIPNGFPTQALKAHPGEGPDRAVIRVATVGRSEKYKRHDLFLQILAAAKGRIFGTLVTSSLLDEAEKQLASQLLTKGWLQIIQGPTRAELENIYRQQDVYLQTSVLEGFCLPAAEAQASGIPVVYTKGSGIDEVVCPHTGTSLDATSDASAWVAAIEMTFQRFSQDSQKLETWVATRPSWNDAAIQLKTLYNSL